MKRLMLLLIITILISGAAYSQNEQADFVDAKNEFQEKLKKQAGDNTSTESEAPALAYKVNPAGIDLPASPDEFKQAWHNPPVSQDLTGSCWSFSSVSFFESEVYRIHERKLELSVMYTTYWEYVEKARRYIRERGDSNFGRGSQANAAPRIWKKYGVVPAGAYLGVCPDDEFFDDRAMYNEMKTYLNSLKESQAWNEEVNIATIRAILDNYMTTPPETIVVDGKTMTSLEYLETVVSLDLDDYVDVMSLKEKPYYQKAEYDVWDNWWNSADYHNVPLDEFMAAIRKSARDGYTICIVGDNSEPGFLPRRDVALIPSFDIPSENIDDNARQFRFSNNTTTDDHAIHLVGWLEQDGRDWYLIKDSGNRAQNGPNAGYMFYREDFVKLKMMNFMAHKDVLGETLIRFDTTNKQ